MAPETVDSTNGAYVNRACKCLCPSLYVYVCLSVSLYCGTWAWSAGSYRGVPSRGILNAVLERTSWRGLGKILGGLGSSGHLGADFAESWALLEESWGGFHGKTRAWSLQDIISKKI